MSGTFFEPCPQGIPTPFLRPVLRFVPGSWWIVPEELQRLWSGGGFFSQPSCPTHCLCGGSEGVARHVPPNTHPNPMEIQFSLGRVCFVQSVCCPECASSSPRGSVCLTKCARAHPSSTGLPLRARCLITLIPRKVGFYHLRAPLIFSDVACMAYMLNNQYREENKFAKKGEIRALGTSIHKFSEIYECSCLGPECLSLFFANLFSSLIFRNQECPVTHTALH